MTKHLDPKDLLKLYCIQKDVHEIINGHMTHVIKSAARFRAPESAALYHFGLYRSLCRRDPVHRPHPKNVAVTRWVPGLKWLQMVCHRDRCVRDILACLAREGHRTPKNMPQTLRKIWLIMDIATTAQRATVAHNDQWFTDQDCYNTQLFIIKLLLRFNGPMDQFADDGLVKVFLGQRGLTPLCQFLKRERFLDEASVIKLCIQYNYYPDNEFKGMQMFGVKPQNIGKGHLEGWGRGRIHLWRIDEIVVRESTRRKLYLDDHLAYMMLWGHVDPITGDDIKPSDEEMYMSDAEDRLRKAEKEIKRIRRDIIDSNKGKMRQYVRRMKMNRMGEQSEEELRKAREEAIKGGMTGLEWDRQHGLDVIARQRYQMMVTWGNTGSHDRDVSRTEPPTRPSSSRRFDDDGSLSLTAGLHQGEGGIELEADGHEDMFIANYGFLGDDKSVNSSDEVPDAWDDLFQTHRPQIWESNVERMPSAGIEDDLMDRQIRRDSEWVMNQKWTKREPKPKKQKDGEEPKPDDDWWCTTDEDATSEEESDEDENGGDGGDGGDAGGGNAAAVAGANPPAPVLPA